MDKIELLRSVLFLRPLPDDVLEAIAGSVHEVTFAPGTRFITEGHVEDDAYLIADGTAEISLRGARVRGISRGDVVGEMAAIARRPRSASVTAVTQVRVLTFTGEFLRDLLRDHPNVAAVLSREMSSRGSG
jgi:CRP-like cAMP-binding protein